MQHASWFFLCLLLPYFIRFKIFDKRSIRSFCCSSAILARSAGSNLLLGAISSINSSCQILYFCLNLQNTTVDPRQKNPPAATSTKRMYLVQFTVFFSIRQMKSILLFLLSVLSTLLHCVKSVENGSTLYYNGSNGLQVVAPTSETTDL